MTPKSLQDDKAFVLLVKAIVERTNLSEAEALIGCSRRSISRIVSGLQPKQIMSDLSVRERVAAVADQLGLVKATAKSAPVKSDNPADFIEEHDVLDVSPAPANALNAPPGVLLDDVKADPENEDLRKIEQMCLAQDHVIQRLNVLVALIQSGAPSDLLLEAKASVNAAQDALFQSTRSVFVADCQPDPQNPVKAFASDIARSSLIGMMQTTQEENKRLKAFLSQKTREVETLLVSLKGQIA